MNKERPFTRLFTTKNINKFLSDLSTSCWVNLTSITDVNAAFNYFDSTLTDIFNKNYPVVRVSRKSFKNKTWITTALKKSINTKHMLYKKWLISRSHVDEVTFKNYSKCLKKLILTSEKEYLKTVLDTRFNSIKIFGEF